MPNAQDHAFALLAQQRGLLGPEQLRQAEALRASLPQDEPLAQLLLKARALPPAAVAALLRDLARGAYGCDRCGERFAYDALARLERLACPRCGGPLLHRADPADGPGLVTSHDSGRLPPPARGTGAFRPPPTGSYAAAPPGAGTGSYAAAPLGAGTGAYAAAPASSGTGAYPAARPAGSRGSAIGPRPSDGAALAPPPPGPPPAAPAAPPDAAVPAVWDAEATVLDRGRRSTGARVAADGTVRQAAGPPTTKGVPAVAPPAGAVDSTRVERIEPIPIPGTSEAVRSIGPYHLISEIGRGQGGVIYLARRQGLERRYAVKVLLGDDLADEEAIKRFQLEAAVASKLDDPGIVGVFDTGRVAGKWYYAMEYVPGETLERRLQRGPLPAPEAARLVAQLARTMQKAHDHGVVHRDLKPANIILEESTGRPKITDFGVARDQALMRSLTRDGELLGTPAYMAPEQLLGERALDHRVDIYALGVILFECVAGRRPFDAKTMILLAEQVAHEDAPPLSSVVPAAPPLLVEVCARALARDRGARYDRAQDLAADLDRVAKGRGGRAAAGGGAARPARSSTLVVAVVTAALVAGVGTVALLLRPGGPPRPDPVAEAARLEAERAARAAAAAAALDAAAAALDAPGVDLAVAGARVEDAAAAAADLPALAERAAGLRRRAQVLRALAAAGDLARRLAPTDEVLAELDRAVAAAGVDRAQSAAVRLDKVELLRRRARFADAQRLGEELSAEAGAVGLRARANAGVCLAVERPTRSREPLARLAADDREGAAGLVAAAILSTLDGDREGALRQADRAVALAPKWELAHFVAARVRRGSRDLDGARAALARALELAPDDAGALYLRAAFALAAGRARAEDVLADLDLAARLGAPAPDLEVLRARATVLAGARRYREALADLDAVVRRAPDDASTLFLRGLVKEVDAPGAADAVDDWRRARGLDEERFEQELANVEDPALRRRVREALGLADVTAPTVRIGEVGTELRQRLEARAAKAAPAAREPLGEALLRAARGAPWRDLDLLLRRAALAAPDDPALALERARLLVGRDVYREAAEACARARALGGPALELDRLEAELLLRQDKRAAAEQAYRDLARRDPDGVEGRCALAEAERLRGRLEPALAAAEAALALDADHPAGLVAKALALADAFDLASDGRPDARLSRQALDVVTRFLARHGALDSRALLARYRASAQVVFGDAIRRRGGGIDPSQLGVIREEFDLLQNLSEGAAAAVTAASYCLYLADPRVQLFARMLLARAKGREPDRPDLLLAEGRFAAVVERDRVQALAAWRKAHELEPELFVIPDLVRLDFEERYGRTPELDALAPRR